MADRVTLTINSAQFAQLVGRFLAAMQQETEQWIATLTARVRAMGYTPVDTGRLQNSWRSSMLNPLTGEVRNATPYARVVEFGGYRGLGPKTVRTGRTALGGGFTAGPGIFSSSAPTGMLRRALAEEGKEMLQTLKDILRKRWRNG